MTTSLSPLDRPGRPPGSRWLNPHGQVAAPAAPPCTGIARATVRGLAAAPDAFWPEGDSVDADRDGTARRPGRRDVPLGASGGDHGTNLIPPSDRPGCHRRVDGRDPAGPTAAPHRRRHPRRGARGPQGAAGPRPAAAAGHRSGRPAPLPRGTPRHRERDRPERIDRAPVSPADPPPVPPTRSTTSARNAICASVSFTRLAPGAGAASAGPCNVPRLGIPLRNTPAHEARLIAAGLANSGRGRAGKDRE